MEGGWKTYRKMKKIQSINPYSGELIQEYNLLTQEEIDQSIDRSQIAFQAWKNESFTRKSNLLKIAGEELRTNKSYYAELITLEMGKVISESLAEIEKCAWVCDFYAEKGAEFLQPETILLADGHRAKVIYQALGPILAVMPWNFPFWQVFRFAAPTLFAGNTALLKHASNVPQCAMAIEEVFKKAGFPSGVFQTLLIDSTQTLTLLENPAVMAVSLTGSEKAGAAVASAAGQNIKKSLLELGGSDPFIVLKDADIPLAAKTAAKARMINFGQSCIAAKRFIIESPVYDQFISIFIEEISSLNQGDPKDPQSQYSCMARPDLAEELFQQVQKSIDLGAKVVLGGIAPKKGSARFAPTILTDIPVNAPAYSEELFGPVACVFKVEDEEEAIKLANSTEFGLAASLWSKNQSHAEELAEKIESGAVFINALVASNPFLPFGGIKKSGFGRELSRQGILEFVNTKTVYLG